MICFPVYYADDYKSCEIFDRTSVTITHSSQVSHSRGRLGYYQGNPATVGSFYDDGWTKAESYSSTGWNYSPDFHRLQSFNFYHLEGIFSEFR